MEKKDYIAPKLKAKEIADEELLAASPSVDPDKAPEEDDGGHGGAKSSFWHNFDNEE